MPIVWTARLFLPYFGCMRKFPLLLLFAAVAAHAATDVPLMCCIAGGSQPRVALTRTGAAFVWSLNGLRAVVTDTLPPIRDDRTIVLSTSPNFRDPAIASDGTDALVVWIEGDAVISTRIGPTVTTLSREVLSFHVGASAPAVAWNGKNYIVAWTHVTNAVVVAAVKQTGQYLGVINVVQRNSEQVPSNLALTSAGNDSLLTWQRTTLDPACVFCNPVVNAEVDYAMIDADGRPRGPNVVVDTGTEPDVAWNGREYFLLWSGFPKGGIFGRRIAANGTAIDFGPIPIAAAPDHRGRLAWNGSSYYVVWFHEVFAQEQIYYAPMTDLGVLGTPIPFAGRLISDFDIDARATGSVVLVRSARPGVGDIASARYIDPRRHAAAP